ncbi:hypothetical protein HDU96_009682 [Phlyctochytrium bullatum]|nr:hypothetical protein HDU96_009682 [Phlyctochytrium bullatum]
MASSTVDQCNALLDLFPSLGTAADCCSRQGVSCTPTQGIVSIDFTGGNLTGPLPADLWRLPNLSTLILNNNSFTGEIPQSWANTSLTFLSVANNSLTGRYPSFIRTLTSAELSRNSFYGDLPLDINRDTTYLGLAYNRFTGSLLPALSNLTRLSWLFIGSNNFTGPIINVNLYQDLTFFTAWGNKLTGRIENFGSHPRLRWYWVEENLLTGELPAAYPPTLTMFGAGKNQLTGTIPNSFSSLPELTDLSLPGNSFTGSLPTSLPRSLEFLDLSNNSLTGGIPTSYMALPNLKRLDLKSNKLSGSLPMTLPETLEVLDVSGNENLSGAFVTAYSTAPNLLTLSLRSTNLTGVLPATLPQRLRYFDVSLTSMTGTLSQTSFPPSLEILYLTSSKFVGSVGESISRLPALKQLDISYTKFGDQLPESLPQSLEYFNARACGFSGGIPSSYTSLSKLQSLDVSWNNLTSSLPNLPNSIVEFEAQSNQISGAIPESYNNLPNLRRLDVSFNRLSSNVPDVVYRLLQLNGTNAVKINSNCFSPADINTSRLANISLSEFVGQSRCAFGDDLWTTTRRPAPTVAWTPPVVNRGEERYVDTYTFKVFMPVASFIFLCAVVVVCLFLRRKKKKDSEEENEEREEAARMAEAGRAKMAAGTATQANRWHV